MFFCRRFFIFRYYDVGISSLGCFAPQVTDDAQNCWKSKTFSKTKVLKVPPRRENMRMEWAWHYFGSTRPLYIFLLKLISHVILNTSILQICCPRYWHTWVVFCTYSAWDWSLQTLTIATSCFTDCIFYSLVFHQNYNTSSLKFLTNKFQGSFLPQPVFSIQKVNFTFCARCNVLHIFSDLTKP